MPKAGGWLVGDNADFTFDVTTPTGQVRLLTNESDAVTAMFSDTEISGYLAMNDSEVKLAAAQLLDTKAVWFSQQGKVEIGSQGAIDKSDGTAVAKTLKAAADELRRQYYEDGSDFEVAEMVTNQFGFVERIYDEALRRG